LSFGLDEEEADAAEAAGVAAAPSPLARTPKDSPSARESPSADDGVEAPRRKLTPNAAAGFVPKVKTKAVLLREAQTREQLRKEFLEKRELVKATDFVIPFVFYDGTNIPGGVCRVKKGDQVWLFLDRARKVGAELGVGGDRGRKEWARISVDDLMMVRGEMIIPQVSRRPIE
jgi:protein FAM50